MEKIKSSFRSFGLRNSLLSLFSIIIIVIGVIFASSYLRKSAQLILGSDSGLILTADREDSLGAFTDTSFTLKSDKDLSVASVKNNIVFFPEIDFDITEVGSRQFSIKPKTPLKDNSLYRIKILSQAKTFYWAFQTKNDFRVVQSLPRDMGTYVPLNSGIEVTFSHDSWEDVNFKNGNFEVTPFVEGRFERHYRTLSFVPKSLAPDTLYTVKVKKGVKLNGSTDVLRDDYVFQFETQPSNRDQSQLYFSRNFYEFSPTETPAFDFYSSSLGGVEVTVKVYQAPPQGFLSNLISLLSIPSWASNSQRQNKFPVSGLSKVLEFNSPIQKQTYTSFVLFPQTLAKGLYIVEASLGVGGGASTQTLVQITDLSAYLSVSGTKTLAWVNDLKSGSPVSGATVAFGSVTGKTESNGTASFDTPLEKLSESTFATASQGSDTLYLPLQNSRYYYDSTYQNTRRQMDKYWTYFYTDRPAYLPTDSVKFWGLLRDRDNLNKKQTFTLEVTRSDYTNWDFTPVILYTKNFETSDLGTFIGEIPLSNFNPGYYGVSLKIGNKVVSGSSFSVEAYTKPAYKVTLNTSKKAYIVGETVNSSGQVSFFEGSPVPAMDLKYSGGDLNGKMTTDSLGRYNFSFTAAPFDNNYSTSPSYKYFYVIPALEEEGEISANASIAIFDSSLVFGYSKTSTKDKIGQVEIDLRQVDTNKFTSGSSVSDIFLPASSKQISGELFENEYVKKEVGTYYDFINKVTSTRYEYSTVQHKIADISLTTDTSGKAAYTFPVTSGKSYNVALRATDDQGRVTSQDSYVSGYSGNYFMNDYVYLKTDKGGTKPNTFSVGENVNLMVMKGESPLSASASDKFLYIFAQRGIKSYQVTSGNGLSFTYPDTFVPNITVSAIRFTGKTYEVAENLNLLFDTSSKKLSLDITKDKSTYLPGDLAKISIQAKNPDGSPAQSEVNLSFVDEAYFALYSQYLDPLFSIYSSLDSDIISFYQSHRYPLDISGAEGGGCFLPGTQILMSDGKTKNIENIKVGDKIKTLASLNSDKMVNAKVIKTFSHQLSGYLVINNHLRVTGEHNLFINGRWMTASEAREGDSFLDTHGNYQNIYSIEERAGMNTVYNFTVEKLNTYFADGFYTHNEKGRELFVDNAFFGSVRTGIDGRASVDVKLPDNLTSWRITSQGVTGDLKVGVDQTPLVVKQPFFVDLVMNTEYLVEDHPEILVRAYGEGLNSGDTVNIQIKSDSLGVSKSLAIKAFESSKIDLGVLKLGVHQITVSGNSGNLSDKLTRNITVIPSRLKIAKTINTHLTIDTKPEGSMDSPTTLIVSDLSLGRFYPPLLNLSYTWGDRLDQRLARILSKEIISRNFDEKVALEKLDTSSFQTPDGGYALFPYSSSDLELSSFVAALAGDKVDRVGLSNYFYRNLSKIQDDEAFSESLFGLASIDEPVLVLINRFRETKDLSPIARIYIGLAQASIGDKENAMSTYRSLISEFAVPQDSMTYMKVGKDKDSFLRVTSLTSALASMLSEKEADGLLAYTISNSTKDILLVSSQLLSITHQIENTKPQPISFAYTLGGKKVSKKLEKGKVFKLELSPKDLGEITFSDIAGNVGLSSTYFAPLDPKTVQTDPSIKIGRSYSVRGKVTNTFAASDLVKVTLPVTYATITQDGCYQVTDVLPSGLKPITSISAFTQQSVLYPYDVNGQKVSFCISKGDTRNSVYYYARVISAGDYKAENAIIQSLKAPSIFNFSPAGSVSIK